MNAKNYNAEMQKIIEALGDKASLLLHACCAPCSSACLERLYENFDVTTFFYNPNIEDEEYLKRKNELIRFITQTGWAKIIDCEHDTSAFYTVAKGLEGCPEGGDRCTKCFELRLERTAIEAKKLGFDYFSTTLTLSPLKDAERINDIGYSLAEKHGVKWLPCDFKKADGYKRSLELSREYSLYRQNFCGCVFSKPNA
ncbi:MAG: epoxyqueuosine reductase QueH [Clostridia bacterium]|nr:epoxyqueuosine reductase QueH [Clostridia bacterium]